jgi:hypothetical protein
VGRNARLRTPSAEGVCAGIAASGSQLRGWLCFFEVPEACAVASVVPNPSLWLCFFETASGTEPRRGALWAGERFAEPSELNRPEFGVPDALYYIRELGPPTKTREMPSLKSQMQFSTAAGAAAPVPEERKGRCQRVRFARVTGDTRR